jgi:DNA repair ATPase RecN
MTSGEIESLIADTEQEISAAETSLDALRTDCEETAARICAIEDRLLGLRSAAQAHAQQIHALLAQNAENNPSLSMASWSSTGLASIAGAFDQARAFLVSELSKLRGVFGDSILNPTNSVAGKPTTRADLCRSWRFLAAEHEVEGRY